MLQNILMFIISPFIRLIRYGALKLIKKFHAPDDHRPIIAVSEHLLNGMVLPSAFHIFRESKFRELAHFGKLPISEHDRIFNELEVAGVWLAIAYLRAVKSLVRAEDYHFWQKVELHLPKQLQVILMGLGVDGANAKLVKQLILMRGQEYDELADKVGEASDEGKEDFRKLSPKMKEIATMVQATAIGTADHIRRGKLQKGDPLVSYLIDWLLALQNKIAKFVKKL